MLATPPSRRERGLARIAGPRAGAESRVDDSVCAHIYDGARRVHLSDMFAYIDTAPYTATRALEEQRRATFKLDDSETFLHTAHFCYRGNPGGACNYGRFAAAESCDYTTCDCDKTHKDAMAAYFEARAAAHGEDHAVLFDTAADETMFLEYYQRWLEYSAH